MADIIQVRRDTAAVWTLVNPILYDGEFGYEIDTNKIKIGNGTDNWVTLPYWQGVNYVVREVLTGAINGTNDTFIMAHTPKTNSEMIFVNGILQQPGAGQDYQLFGNSVVFNSYCIPTTGESVMGTYFY